MFNPYGLSKENVPFRPGTLMLGLLQARQDLFEVSIRPVYGVKIHWLPSRRVPNREGLWVDRKWELDTGIDLVIESKKTRFVCWGSTPYVRCRGLVLFNNNSLLLRCELDKSGQGTTSLSRDNFFHLGLWRGWNLWCKGRVPETLSSTWDVRVKTPCHRERSVRLWFIKFDRKEDNPFK